MRLLFLNHNVAGRGTYLRAHALAREMVTRGNEVTLVTTSPAARVRAECRSVDGVRVMESPDLLWGPARTGWDPYNAVRRMKLLWGERFDLVHAFDSRPAVVIPALAAARAGAALVMDWADWWGRGGTIDERSGWFVRTFFGPIETWFEESFRTRGAGATVISAALGQRSRELGVPPERVLLLPNGCRPPDPLRPARAEARRRLQLEDVPLLVHLGTAHRREAALMFEAFRRARAVEPNLRLALVGALRDVPTDLVTSGAVRTAGFVSPEDLAFWMASADACVIPLRDSIASRGRWPSKVNEYFTAGRATVIPEVGDVAAYVRAARAGFLCTPDPDSFAEAMVRSVRDGTERWAAERNALELASTTLAWSALAATLEGFYRVVLERQPQALSSDKRAVASGEVVVG